MTLIKGSSVGVGVETANFDAETNLTHMIPLSDLHTEGLQQGAETAKFSGLHVMYIFFSLSDVWIIWWLLVFTYASVKSFPRVM